MTRDIDMIQKEDKDKFLGLCLERFGSMNKNDYEVALFTLLLRSGWNKKTDFDISCMLKVPETKIKRLRYESNLVYPNNENLKEQLKDLLKKAKYRMTDSNKIQFLIVDKLLRQYANNILEERGSFADSSFNSSIVSVTPEDMMLLLGYVTDKETNETNEILQNAKEELRKSNQGLPNKTKEKVMKASKNLLAEIGKIVTSNCTQLIMNYIEQRYK